MWRSLVARVVRDDEVAGSNPVIPTNQKRAFHLEGPLFCVRAPVYTFAVAGRIDGGHSTAPASCDAGAVLQVRDYIGSGQLPTLVE